MSQCMAVVNERVTQTDWLNVKWRGTGNGSRIELPENFSLWLSGFKKLPTNVLVGINCFTQGIQLCNQGQWPWQCMIPVQEGQPWSNRAILPEHIVFSYGHFWLTASLNRTISHNRNCHFLHSEATGHLLFAPCTCWPSWFISWLVHCHEYSFGAIQSSWKVSKWPFWRFLEQCS